jgi:hypothetical protein
MILLLTGCINPSGMSYTSLNNPKEREIQYVNAIRYYLSKTNYPIVFTENSGTDISQLFTDSIKSGRMEYFSFNGNQNKERGKGYGECEILQYALEHSVLINTNKSKRIAKITGRLIIQNIKSIIRWHTLFTSQQTTLCSFNSDLSFPDSRFIIASKEFYHTFLKTKENINDSSGYYFEHALCDTIKKEKAFAYSPFFMLPRIEGISGSTGKEYTEQPSSTATFSHRYAKYALSQLRRFNKTYR